ncbi:beta-N-acetylhexosaminidase [Candidatus Bathyarchaeota archaeon]|nr:MAG: beta-N-acetylhexosaminidase [Candidatus Bathyarchaeota archaeon]
MKEIHIVPEPKNLKFSGRSFVFDGFENFPEFLTSEFDVPKGGIKIKEISREGTGLRIKEKEVVMWGDRYVNYATILQLLMQDPDHLPEVTVEEKFNFAFRGYHLDIARGGVPTVETFKKILRWLFLLKYNYFAIYFEDLFPWKKHPIIGKHRGRLTEDELREVMLYGKNLGIEVFPSLELSGHMEHILSLPEYRKFSEWHRPSEGCLDLSNEEAREFAYELLREAVEFCSSKHVHIGGDETWALGRGRSLSKTWTFEGPKLYEMHHRNMIEIVKKAGKKSILWGDMISGMYLKRITKDASRWSEVIESPIWKEALIANWDYSPNTKEYFKEKIRIFKDRGLQQIVCPGLSNWRRYYPNFQTALENLRNFLEAAKETEVDGFLITAWGDDGEECLFSLLEPLLLASMEIAEGNGRWEEKWMALRGENKEVLKARILFGDPDVSENLKHIIFRDFEFHRMSNEERKNLKDKWKKILRETGEVQLPKDLEFIRRLLNLGVKVLSGEAGVSDYIALSKIYAELWLNERKPEGLERIIERFWGAAGREDMNLR